jgi:hypothetical protein
MNSMKNKILLIDCDGTVCTDIKNEDSHLYSSAEVLDGSLETLNGWYEEGAHITFFTARSEKDRDVTKKWLDDNGFKYHGLIMDKPRCLNDNDEYAWIDNRKVRGITYKGKWGQLIESEETIEVFKK